MNFYCFTALGGGMAYSPMNFSVSAFSHTNFWTKRKLHELPYFLNQLHRLFILNQFPKFINGVIKTLTEL